MRQVLAAGEPFKDRKTRQNAHKQPAEEAGHCQERALHRWPQTQHHRLPPSQNGLHIISRTKSVRLGEPGVPGRGEVCRLGATR